MALEPKSNARTRNKKGLLRRKYSVGCSSLAWMRGKMLKASTEILNGDKSERTNKGKLRVIESPRSNDIHQKSIRIRNTKTENKTWFVLTLTSFRSCSHLAHPPKKSVAM